MAVNKEHKELHQVDLTSGWETMPSCPAGIQQKILAGALDENDKQGGPLAPPALRARCLHYCAVRARLLGRGLPHFR
jgi:hypothetical protein